MKSKERQEYMSMLFSKVLYYGKYIKQCKKIAFLESDIQINKCGQEVSDGVWNCRNESNAPNFIGVNILGIIVI